jgi:hypothetical protein
MKRLWLMLAVLFSSVLPSFSSLPATALSNTIVIQQVQTGGAGTGTATHELILLKNLSADAVDVTGWCVDYLSATAATTTKLTCLLSSDVKTKLLVHAGGIVILASNEMVAANPGLSADAVFSAGLAAAGGHVRLRDAANQEIDRVGWGTAAQAEGGLPATPHVSGQSLSRLQETDVNSADFISQPIQYPLVSGLYEEIIIIDQCPNLEAVQETIPEGYMKNSSGDCLLDLCQNIEGLQIEVPVTHTQVSGQQTCEPIPLEDAIILITELLPNAKSYDTGKEFIELYNPNDRDVNLGGYTLQAGPAYTKSFVFDQRFIGAKSYLVLSDTETGLTLPNTSASLRLLSAAGVVVDETALYSNPKDDIVWALVAGEWIYSNQQTPGAANLPYLLPAVDETVATAVYAPCPAGKYRNPDTNRCRTIERAVSTLKPCDEDEERNPLTNRCRKVKTAAALAPCKPGQVRNPETNRCRLVQTAVKPCPEGQERNPDTNRCRKIKAVSDTAVLGASVIDQPSVTKPAANVPVVLIILLLTAAYIVYEWRIEIARVIKRIIK